MSQARQKDRIVLVTGASRGIGRAVALGLAKEGAHVVALARTQGALEELDDEISAAGGSASLVVADLSDGQAIDRLAPALKDRWGRLDGVVANAAMLGPLTPLSHIDPKEWEQTLAVNLTANYRLIRAVDPLLRASEAARVVFVSSRAAQAPRAFWAAYGATKGALEAMAISYAAETEKTNIRVNIFDPGPTRTAMRAKAMPGEDPATLPPPEEIAASILDLMDPAEQRTGARVAQRDLRSAPA